LVIYQEAVCAICEDILNRN